MQPYRNRFLILLLLTGGLLVLWTGMFFDEPHPDQPASREAIWRYIQSKAPASGLDPHFVYAVVKAESTFNPRAQTSVARGLMQLTSGAWQTVSDEPYRNAWNWRDNLNAGIAYLAHLKAQLEAEDQFSYAHLAAAYRFGPARLKSVNYDIDRLPAVRNRIYARILSGDPAPVAAP